MKKIVKILIVASSPYDADVLRSDRELKKIKRLHRQCKNRWDFELIFEPAISFRNFHDDLWEYRPDILHFICHTTYAEEFCFENDSNGLPDRINWTNIASVIGQSGGVKAVFLNTCHSRRIAEMLHKTEPRIPVTIGIEGSWPDEFGITLSELFYSDFFETSDIKKSLENALRSMDTQYGTLGNIHRSLGLTTKPPAGQKRPSEYIFLYC